MLDMYMRPLIDPLLNKAGRFCVKLGIKADWVTLTGFIFGVCAVGCISMEYYRAGLGLILLNRLCDGLDGGVARQSEMSDFGGFLDILCDFIVYSGIIFAFAVASPDNTFAACFLLFSYVGPITSFLAYAIVAAKKDIETSDRGHKSFYYLGGICEGSETFLVMILMCLFPEHFSILAYAYGVLCWLTTFGRSMQAWQDFTKQ